MLRPLAALALLLALLPHGASAQPQAAESQLDLAGDWRFALDREGVGETEKWFAKDLPDHAKLPGSITAQGFGDDVTPQTKWTGGTGDGSWWKADRYAPYRRPGNIKLPFWLQPDKVYVGAAFVQRDVTVPDAWRGQRVVLHLERPHWVTTLWLDEKLIGTQNALGVPHDYDFGAQIAPGPHRLTLRVDNRVVIPVGHDAHSVTDHTQGNWNGVVGAITLYATPPVWIDDIQVYPNLAKQSAQVIVKLGNATGAAGTAMLKTSLEVSSGGLIQPLYAPRPMQVAWTARGGQAELELSLGAGPHWDEFQPALHRLTLTLDNGATRTVTFGYRQVGVRDKQIVLNDRKLFLRGTLECCIFPKTGYPPTDVESWKRILTVARAHGLNHLRFHSWCPPEAAFIAADELGFYFQVEVSAWSFDFNKGTALDKWIYAESERMARAYGNHPSFLLMVASNEPGGPNYQEFFGKFVDYWKARDPRRLYSAGSGWPAIPANQYHVTPGARGFPTRARAGETAGDYRGFLANQTVPIVSHEIGQYCVFPNLEEIPKYTGHLKPKNFEIVRDFLAQHGMVDQAKDFLLASGKVQALFYKDEIEACLRTPGWAGFQLLDLHDFPGQGTALVGVLDPFWEEKGYITAAEYRRFCNATVPLARLPKRVFTSSETFSAVIDVAHFGPADLSDARATWRIRDAAGQTLAGGNLPAAAIPTGGLTSLGQIDLKLAGLPAPAALNLEVTLPTSAGPLSNDWHFWLYPDPTTPAPAPPAAITLAHALDPAALSTLEQGGRVLLLPPAIRLAGDTFGSFNVVFWNKLWFPGQKVHTLGLLCDPMHRALALFPTAFHADWQWQDLMNNSKPMVLDGLPKSLRPLVQPIDDWNTCRKLGLILEAKVGPGRLLVCSIDLDGKLRDHPAAQQLRRSLLAYAAGERFNPTATLTVPELQTLFREPTAMEKLGAKVVRADSAARGYEAAHLLDGDPNTLWHTPWEGNPPGFPHEVIISFAQPVTLRGVRLTPRQDNNPNGWIKDCAIYLSADGKDWGDPVLRATLTQDATAKELTFPHPATGQYLKLVARSTFTRDRFASLAELEVIPAD